MALCIFRESDLTKMLEQPVSSVIQMQNEPVKMLYKVNHTEASGLDGIGRYLQLNYSVERLNSIQVITIIYYL